MLFIGTCIALIAVAAQARLHEPRRYSESELSAVTDTVSLTASGTRGLVATACGAATPSALRSYKPTGPFKVNDQITFTLRVKGNGGTTTTAMPIDVVFAIDMSGSMLRSDPNFLRLEAAKNFLGNLDATTDQAGLVGWDDAVDLKVALSTDFATLETDIDSLQGVGGGSTDFNLGLTTAITVLEGDQRTSGVSKNMIFLTDGVPNFGNGYTTYANGGPAKVAKDKGIAIYSVGLGADAGTPSAQTILHDMADNTGGTYTFAGDANALGAIFTSIFKSVVTNNVPQDTLYTEVVDKFLLVKRASVTPAPASFSKDAKTGQTTIIWALGALSATDTGTLSYKAVVQSTFAVQQSVAINSLSGLTYSDMAGTACGLVNTPETDIEFVQLPVCDSGGHYKIAGVPTPTAMELPDPTGGDKKLTSTGGTVYAITSDDPDIAKNLVSGQTCSGNSAWYYVAGTKVDLPDHMLFTTQLLFMKSTVQSYQLAAYKAACGQVINLQLTCNNGLPTDVICFKALCPWL